MPTTHPRRATGATIAVTPLYFEKMEAQARAEQEAHPWRYTAKFESAFWRNLRPFLTDPDMPVVWEEIRDELDAAARIAAAHPLNPEGAYERLLARERAAHGHCPDCGTTAWEEYQVKGNYYVYCRECNRQGTAGAFWMLEKAEAIS